MKAKKISKLFKARPTGKEFCVSERQVKKILNLLSRGLKFFGWMRKCYTILIS